VQPAIAAPLLQQVMRFGSGKVEYLMAEPHRIVFCSTRYNAESGSRADDL
jgi:hypothetical protein